MRGEVRAEFEAVQRNFGRYSLTTAEAIVRRLEAAKGKYPEGALFTYQLDRDRAGRFHLSWGLDAEALARWQALEGVYALKTNLPGGPTRWPRCCGRTRARPRSSGGSTT